MESSCGRRETKRETKRERERARQRERERERRRRSKDTRVRNHSWRIANAAVQRAKRSSAHLRE
eukprot:scaffold1307_cov200-Pinguiococcus_pyrenoidosus.AAC.144